MWKHVSSEQDKFYQLARLRKIEVRFHKLFGHIVSGYSRTSSMKKRAKGIPPPTFSLSFCAEPPFRHKKRWFYCAANISSFCVKSLGQNSSWVRHTVLYTKWYKNSNEYCTFLFRADWVILDSAENSSILLKCPTFEGVFSCFHWQNNEKIWISLNYNCKFLIQSNHLGQNRLKHCVLSSL